MKYKVLKKQKNSKMCFCCGMENAFGFQAYFYELENGELVGLFTPREEHQSYPGRTHGGLSAAILDECLGRVIMVAEPGVWGVTVKLNLEYKKPVPLNVPLRVVSRITSNNRRLFEATGEILLPDGQKAATAWGKYMKLPVDKITDADLDADSEMFYVPDDRDPQEIEL